MILILAQRNVIQICLIITTVCFRHEILLIRLDLLVDCKEMSSLHSKYLLILLVGLEEGMDTVERLTMKRLS